MKHSNQIIVSFIAFYLLSISSVLAADEKTIKQGADIYAQNCVFCHQADAIGKAGFAPSLSNPEFLSLASDKFILGTIRDGRQGTGMPPFAHIGRDQGRAILAYLRSFSELLNRAAEVDAQPAAIGDAGFGEKLFENICATCHGPKGDGYVAGGTGTAIGKIGTLSKVSDGFLRATIKEGRSNTRMRGFAGPEGLANLNDQEIDDIIAYLRTLAK